MDPWPIKDDIVHRWVIYDQEGGHLVFTYSENWKFNLTNSDSRLSVKSNEHRGRFLYLGLTYLHLS